MNIQFKDPNPLTRKQEANAKKLEKLLERSGVKIDGDWSYLKLKSDPYMPLSIDKLNTASDGLINLALAHNSKQNGDVMADPDMEFAYIPASANRPSRMAGLHYQNDYMGAYKTVAQGNTTQKELDSFAGTWLSNLLEQGHKLDDFQKRPELAMEAPKPEPKDTEALETIKEAIKANTAKFIEYYEFFKVDRLERITKDYKKFKDTGDTLFQTMSNERIHRLKDIGYLVVADMRQSVKDNETPFQLAQIPNDLHKAILNEAMVNIGNIPDFQTKYKVNPELFKEGVLTTTLPAIFKEQDEDMFKAVSEVNPEEVLKRYGRTLPPAQTFQEECKEWLQKTPEERWSKAPSKKEDTKETNNHSPKFKR